MTTNELVKVMASTFVASFMFSGFFGYIGGATGLFTVTVNLLEFTVWFSTFAGLSGAGLAWIRNRKNVNSPLIRGWTESVFGANSNEKSLLDYIYIPGNGCPAFNEI